MITNKIYAYFEEVGMDGQYPLMELWKERWRAEGWEPEILTGADAKADPRYERMESKARSFPHLPNTQHYERANFMRWLAFSHVDGAVADYDVFPIRPFPPQDFGDLPVSGDGAGGPGFIVGTGKDFSKIADTILAYEAEPDDRWANQPHLCDMRIMRKRWEREKLYRIQVKVICYSDPNFETVPLMHIASARLDAMTDFYRKMDRVTATKILLERYYRLA